MPSSTPIPAAAVEALLESKVGRLEEGLNRLNEKSRAALRDRHRDGCRVDLEAAEPHLLAVFKERLLGDEAVEAVARRLARRDPDFKGMRWETIPSDYRRGFRDKARRDLEAALSEVTG